jgi:hypothetical protein
VFGERGSIDLLAWHESSRTLLVIELKTELTSVEETLRRHDSKVRLAPGIARERFGWIRPWSRGSSCCRRTGPRAVGSRSIARPSVACTRSGTRR